MNKDIRINSLQICPTFQQNKYAYIYIRPSFITQKLLIHETRYPCEIEYTKSIGLLIHQM